VAGGGWRVAGGGWRVAASGTRDHGGCAARITTLSKLPLLLRGGAALKKWRAGRAELDQRQ
jgi:hypothetical protein